jgi:hypothetical protein
VEQEVADQGLTGIVGLSAKKESGTLVPDSFFARTPQRDLSPHYFLRTVGATQ